MNFCTFCGHEDFDYALYENQMLNLLIPLVEYDSPVTFYLGGYGDFDLFCAKVLHKLKKIYTQIKRVLVVPCENLIRSKAFYYSLYDKIIFPNFEKISFNYAILERNKWMIDNSKIIISGFNYKNGDTYKTLSYARNKNKCCYELCKSTFTKQKSNNLT